MCQSCIARGDNYLFLILHFLALCQDSPISMMSSGEQRDVVRYTFRKAKNLLPTSDRREESFVCNRCLQSPSCDKLPCDICGKNVI